VDGLAELIRAQMAAHDDPVVARWIFGVVDPDRIRRCSMRGRRASWAP
jgi:hypothetical protein